EYQLARTLNFTDHSRTLRDAGGIPNMSKRAECLAERVEQGAKALLSFVQGLSDAEWQTPCLDDGRTVGVLVHHVANMYTGESDGMRYLASGGAIADLTWNMVAEGNAQHARDHAQVGKVEALELLQRNSRLAADAIRALTDDQLDQAAPLSL